MIGKTIGPYEVVAKLGAGGMGEVYRALDRRLNRHVAIKVWPQSTPGDDGQTRRMHREARAASALNHPNIVVIHELGETPDGEAYIVQEFIEGRTLRERASPDLALETVADIGAQVARALGAAHAAGIVHRDIKPDNVMVRDDGYVKVLDFGIAQVTDAGAADTTHTALDTGSHQFKGTPAYVSPEQVQGAPVGPPADIFSLGVVLYELASGRRPFEGRTTAALLASVTTATPVPLGRLRPEVPRSFDDLVQAMLDKRPEKRPTAAEVEAALRPDRKKDDLPVRVTSTVGREAPLGELRDAYRRVRAGRGLMVGVAGEPGIGKTRVLDEFLEVLRGADDRPTVARGRCSENLAGSEAYLPVLEALDSLRIGTGTGSVDALMRSVAPTWYAQIGVPTDPGEGGGRDEAPAASQERMKRELRALLQDLSRRAPVVWCIDDLHWADVSTIDILNYLSGFFDDTRVLIVACFRPSDMALAKHAFLAIQGDLSARGRYEEIPLSLLTEDDVRDYLALEFPDNRFPASFVADIHARTEGSPLFMADLVRYLRDTGGIVEQDGAWALAHSLPESPRDLPASVSGMIARKIERVDDDNRKLLLAASVQGQEFDAVLVAEALGLDAADVEDALEDLERAHRLVAPEGEHEYPDRTLTMRYRFVHVLYQNVLYGSLKPARRASLSGKTAQALAAHHGADAGAVAGRLAVLFETARDFASAAQYFYLAAQRAVGLFAFREALTLAERGLAGLEGLPAGPGKLQLELGLQMVRGLALRSVKGWAAPELEPTFARARQICQELEDPPELFPVLWNLAFFNMIRGNIPTVREQLVTLTAQAKAATDTAFLMAACHVDGVTNEFGGDVETSTRLLEQARALHDPARHPEYNAMFGIDPGMVARAMSARPLWALGYADQALARAKETIALCRSQRQPVTLVFALIVCEGIHLYRGEAEEAIALGDEIVALCREYEFPQEAEWGRAFQGAAYPLADRLDEGVAQLQDSLAALHALKSGLVRTMFLSLLADALARAGRVAEGLAVVDEGFAHAEATLEHGFLHELQRARGNLFAADGRVDEAERSFRKAVDLARERNARAFELRAAHDLARLLASTDRKAEARDVLAPVCAWFTEGRETADQTSARRLLASLE